MALNAVVVSPAPLGVGGQGIVARDMLDGLHANGCPATFVGDRRPTPLVRLAAARPLRRFKALRRELERREVMRRVTDDWDLAYALPGYLPNGSGVKVLHQATRHPLVVQEALATARARAGGGRGFMSPAELRLLLREIDRADIVRAESRAVADELIAMGVDTDRVVHAPGGVDLDRYQPAAKPDRLTVAFVGPLALWKGWDLVVGLIRHLRDVHFVVVGGPVDSWARDLLDGLDVERATDVGEVLARSHALLLPSAADGFAYVVLEALASGCVPLVTPMVGAAEIVRELDERLVIDAEHFVERAAVLLPETPDLGFAARDVAERYGREAMAEQAAARILEHVH